jgi:hypothetical protein
MDESMKWRATPTLPIVRVDDTLQIYLDPRIKAAPLTCNRQRELQIRVVAATTATTA